MSNASDKILHSVRAHLTTPQSRTTLFDALATEATGSGAMLDAWISLRSTLGVESPSAWCDAPGRTRDDEIAAIDHALARRALPGAK